jgi:hypothetical protein
MKTWAEKIIEDYHATVEDVIISGQGKMDWEPPYKAPTAREMIDDYLGTYEKQIQIEKEVRAEIDNDPVYQARLRAIADYNDAKEAEEEAESDAEWDEIENETEESDDSDEYE